MIRSKIISMIFRRLLWLSNENISTLLKENRKYLLTMHFIRSLICLFHQKDLYPSITSPRRKEEEKRVFSLDNYHL
jgi:hypothetical protein